MSWLVFAGLVALGVVVVTIVRGVTAFRAGWGDRDA